MATTTTYGLNKPTVGGDENTWGGLTNDNWDDVDDLLDGTTPITPNLGAGWEVDGVAVTATAAELNILDGVTASTAELNILDGVTASTAEINLLDGVTATTAELNHTDGVTSNIQTQLDGKQAALGFTPVQQGGGTSQGSNKVYIGWDGGGLRAQVDATDLGRIAFGTDTAGGIGTYAMLTIDRVSGGADVLPGDTVAGSSLTFASASGATPSGNPSGTWRCMGAASRDSTTSGPRTSLWLRTV